MVARAIGRFLFKSGKPRPKELQLSDDIKHEYCDGDHRLVVNGVAGEWAPYYGIAVNEPYIATAKDGSKVFAPVQHAQY